VADGLHRHENVAKMKRSKQLDNLKFLDNGFWSSYTSLTDLYCQESFKFPRNNFLLKDKKGNNSLVTIHWKDETSIKIEPVKAFKKQQLKLNGYYQPIKFKRKKLYGYYPFQKEAKFTELGDYNFHFAPFVEKGDIHGWLTLSGTLIYAK